MAVNFGGNKPWRDPAGSSYYGNDEDKSQKRTTTSKNDSATVFNFIFI